MPISVECSDCKSRYSVAEAMAGKRVKCKKCGNSFMIPAATAATAASAAPAAPAAAEEDDPLAAMMAMERNSDAIDVAAAPPLPTVTAAPPPLPAPMAAQ